MTDGDHAVSASLTAQNTFTDWMAAPNATDRGGLFDVSISGTFVATVTLQRKRVQTANGTAVDIKTYTAPVEETGEQGGTWWVRAGIKTGDFTSGTIVIVLSR